VFNPGGKPYLVTSGTTSGDSSPAGINPGDIWTATSISSVGMQPGLVYGFTSKPTPVTRSGTGVFQQMIDANNDTALYDIQYQKGGSTNQVLLDTPNNLSAFWQAFSFGATYSPYPLTFETGGYNAFTTAIEETATPQKGQISDSFVWQSRAALKALPISGGISVKGS